jgi:hypothetical protein
MNIEVTEISDRQLPVDINFEKPNINQTERNISLVAGSFILWKSIKNIFKHPTLALYGAALGGVLIYRGTTGVCPLYKQLGKDTSDEYVSLTELL